MKQDIEVHSLQQILISKERLYWSKTTTETSAIYKVSKVLTVFVQRDSVQEH